MNRLFLRGIRGWISSVEGEPWQLGDWVNSGRVDFAIATEHSAPSGVVLEELRKWPRVLLFNTLVQYGWDFSAYTPAYGEDTVFERLADETVLIPPRNVMPELEKYLKPPRKGRHVKLPQASLRRAWVQQGLPVVAISHEEKALFNGSQTIDPVRSIVLESLKTTTLCFYFQRDRESLSAPSRALVEAIESVYGERLRTA